MFDCWQLNLLIKVNGYNVFLMQNQQHLWKSQDQKLHFYPHPHVISYIFGISGKFCLYQKVRNVTTLAYLCNPKLRTAVSQSSEILCWYWFWFTGEYVHYNLLSNCFSKLHVMSKLRSGQTCIFRVSSTFPLYLVPFKDRECIIVVIY